MFCLNFICVKEKGLYCFFCQNGASCEEQGITARCHCADGYYGDGCGKWMKNKRNICFVCFSFPFNISNLC